MRHFAVLTVFALGRLFGPGGSFGCTTTFAPASGECPCDGSTDCDRTPGEGCGCGATDNKGGGCDTYGSQFSCDQDNCGNDKCDPINALPGGMDMPCKTIDNCFIDWSACAFGAVGGADKCDYDNPCGCSDTIGQPTMVGDNGL